MAQKVQIMLVDDVDGSEATQTVYFALDGVSYEIDLNDANAAELRQSMGRWLDSARRVRGRARAPRARAMQARTDLALVRSWARKNGYTVSDRGRVSADILEAYDAAN